MLKMSKVSKTYRTDTVETKALREFSLTVDEGEFVSVTGPSGSGKTTFLNIAGMLEELSGGTYELDGRDISKLNDTERSKVRNDFDRSEAACAGLNLAALGHAILVFTAMARRI